MSVLIYLGSLLNDTITYAFNPSNKGEIIFQILLAIVFLILPFAFVIFWTPIRIKLLAIWKWIDMHRINPELDMEIIISGRMPSINPDDFVVKMREGFSPILGEGITAYSGDSLKFSKKFNSFIGDITISPSFDVRGSNYDSLFIRLRTANIRLKNFKDGLSEIQIYVFRDLVGTIIQKIKFEADKNNEGISIMFKRPPLILQSTGGLEIEDISASGEGIRVSFFNDNISFNGSIEPRNFEKIENIIRSNLIA